MVVYIVGVEVAVVHLREAVGIVEVEE